MKTEARGEDGTLSFRRFFRDAEDREISPWHDLPLETGVEGEYWMVTEISRMTKAKMEMATKEAGNPLAQDKTKGDAPREYHGPIFWNYGFLPRTWEDPTVKHPGLSIFGDNDPLDVVEIGSKPRESGEVVRVKVLGSLAMIDSGELDWKVLAIAIDDPAAAELQDISDVEEQMPGVVSGVREWFRWYKVPDGKPLNEFGFGEEPLGQLATLQVIEETHTAWRRLKKGIARSGDLWTGGEGEG